MVKSYASVDDLRIWPRATRHNVCSCYLMSCLVNVPLSSVRSRRCRCARLCLRDGSAYTSFLRIHTQGSSRQSNLWGKQQHTHSVFNCKENTNKATRCLSVSSCSASAQDFFSVSSHKLYLNSVTVKVAGKGGWGQIQVILCSPVTQHPCSETCWTITPGSFWLKAWEWSADCINYRPEITADQGLSDNIYTGHFILLSV